MITIDLNDLNAEQIAMIDAALTDASRISSATKSTIARSGEINCGIDEYERLYYKYLNFLRGSSYEE